MEFLLGLPNTFIHTCAQQCVDKEQIKHWQAMEGCHQAIMFLNDQAKGLHILVWD